MRTCYDGINSDAPIIPTAAQLVAGYVDGDYRWSAADWARFPHSRYVRIAVHQGTDDGHVLDVETGNATPEQSVNWALTRRHSGADPTIYCSASVWPAVRAAFAHHDVPEPHWWIASYNGDTAIPAGAIAHQYVSTPHWDLSSVAEYWPGVDPAPLQRDARVVDLQQLLNSDGAHLSEDGQKGPLTKGAFAAAMARVGTLSQGSTGLDVKILQAMLNTWWSLGIGQLVVDGQFGPLTTRVTEAFQFARHVPNSVVDGHGDGHVGPATKAALAV